MPCILVPGIAQLLIPVSTRSSVKQCFLQMNLQGIWLSNDFLRPSLSSLPTKQFFPQLVFYGRPHYHFKEREMERFPWTKVPPLINPLRRRLPYSPRYILLNTKEPLALSQHTLHFFYFKPFEKLHLRLHPLTLWRRPVDHFHKKPCPVLLSPLPFPYISFSCAQDIAFAMVMLVPLTVVFSAYFYSCIYMLKLTQRQASRISFLSVLLHIYQGHFTLR